MDEIKIGASYGFAEITSGERLKVELSVSEFEKPTDERTRKVPRNRVAWIECSLASGHIHASTDKPISNIELKIRIGEL